MGAGRPRTVAGDSLLRARHGGQGSGGLRASAWRERRHPDAAGRRACEVGRAVPAAGMSSADQVDRFRDAARAYFAYAVVYWIGGVYLVWNGVGIAGEATPSKRAVSVAFWAVVGLVPMLVIPYLLRRSRPWFERWILSRRDFARILALVMAWRALEVLRVVLRSGTATVPAPWGGGIPFRAGAAVFFVVTVAALALVARAAWAPAEERARADEVLR